ncbi:MAG: hypothetical protein QGG09_13270, partial [Pirellulaceae bacterium]|nr:hypothetical protein [Pirellulaceae bacterium]
LVPQLEFSFIVPFVASPYGTLIRDSFVAGRRTAQQRANRSEEHPNAFVAFYTSIYWKTKRTPSGGLSMELLR